MMGERFEKVRAAGFRVYVVLHNNDVVRIYENKSREAIALVDGRVLLIDKKDNTVLVFGRAEDFAMFAYRWLKEQLEKEVEWRRRLVERAEGANEERDKLMHCERKLRLLREAKLIRLYVGIDKVFEVPIGVSRGE